MTRFSLPLSIVLSLTFLNACGGGGTTSTLPPPPPNATHFSVSAPANASNAISFNFTVSALDASNHTVTNYSGTVHFTSTDRHAQLPPDSMLVSGPSNLPATTTT